MVQYISSTATGFGTRNSGEIIADLGIRPFGTQLLTLFGDYGAMMGRQDGRNWSAGTVLEPLPGIRITGRYFDTRAFAVGLSVDGHVPADDVELVDVEAAPDVLRPLAGLVGLRPELRLAHHRGLARLGELALEPLHLAPRLIGEGKRVARWASPW